MYPQMGRVVPEFKKHEIREIFVYNYRVIYEVQSHAITVLTIIHLARELGEYQQMMEGFFNNGEVLCRFLL